MLGQLKVTDLSVQYQSATGPIEGLKSVSFELNEGESLGVIGPSGCGKSTLGLSIARLLPAGAQVTSGKVEYAGKQILQFTRDELRAWRGSGVAMVFQEPRASLNPLVPVGQQLKDILKLHSPQSSPSTLQTQCSDFFAQVGLDFETFKSRYPHELSGGQNQRLIIAMALACQPKLLICDEPTSSLDSITQFQILSLLKSLQSTYGFGLLFISHDLRVLQSLCSRVLDLQTGVVSDSVRPPATSNFGFSSESSSEVSPHSLTMLSVRHLSKKSNLNHSDLLSDISFDVRKSEVFGIVGSTGSGKTTLARCLLKLISIDQGEVIFPSFDETEIRKHAQIIFQNAEASLNPSLTVAELLNEPLQIHRKNLSAMDRKQEIDSLLRKVGLEISLKDRLPQTLSGGQKQRVSVARALAVEPQLLICDEPFSAQDLESQNRVLDLILQLRAQMKLTVILITHDLRLIQHCADRIAVLSDGKLVELDFTAQVLAHPQHPQTKALVEGALLKL